MKAFPIDPNVSTLRPSYLCSRKWKTNKENAIWVFSEEKIDFVNDVCQFKILQKTYFNKHLETIRNVRKDTQINCIFMNKQQATRIAFNLYNVLANVLCSVIILAENTENYEKRNMINKHQTRPIITFLWTQRANSIKGVHPNWSIYEIQCQEN